MNMYKVAVDADECPRRRVEIRKKKMAVDADECRRRQELNNMVEIRKKKREKKLQKKEASSSWDVKYYESTTYADDSKYSISFSIKIQGIEKEPVEIFSEIPNVYLAEEEICSRFVFDVLSKAKIHISIQNHIVPKLSKELIALNNLHGFVKVEAGFKKTNLREEDSDEDCIICGEELSLGMLTKTETRSVTTIKAYATPSDGPFSTVIIKRNLERVSSVGSSSPTSLLPDITLTFRDFTTEYVHQVIQHQFHEPLLSRQISDQVVLEAQRFPHQTLFLMVFVNLTEKIPKQETFANMSEAKAIIQVHHCQHVFHKSCMFEWMKEHKSCPLCCRPLF